MDIDRRGMMGLNEYQDWTKLLAMYKPQYGLEYTALGLAGEAGEVANEVKRKFRQDKEVNLVKVKDELGDTLWYLARCAAESGFTLEELAIYNMNKLTTRHSH